MFANSDRNTNRRIAGYLGGVLGAACVLLAVYPGIAAAAPALTKLTLTSVCTLPKGDAVLLVENTNASSIPYTWDIRTTPFAGKGVAPAGDSYLQVPSSTAGNTRLFVDGKQQAAKKQNDKECVYHVQPTKRWVDATGDAVPSPAVPKGWKLTLDSDYETLICTWKKDALSCKSKIDVEDKGEFAAEKPYLDVPFGGSYTITETATPGFVQEGTGKFAVDTPKLDESAALAKFFGGGEDVFVTVTNRQEAIVAATTTIAATTTVEEQTTTTTVDEPTTTTTVDEPTTTTTVDEPTTTTTVDEPTTTTTVDEPTTTTTVDEPTTTTTVDEPTTTTTVDEETTTTIVDTTTTVDEETTTTIAASDDRATDEATSTTTVAEPTTTAATTTVAPLTTQSPTTTLAPAGDERPADTEASSTTQAPTTTQGTAAQLAPQTGEDLTVRSAEATNDPGAGVEPAHDTLPVTGVAAGAIAIVGFALVGIGLVVVALGRRRLV